MGVGAVVVFGWRLHRGDYGQASDTLEFSLAVLKSFSTWNLLTLNA